MRESALRSKKVTRTNNYSNSNKNHHQTVVFYFYRTFRLLILFMKIKNYGRQNQNPHNGGRI